MKKRLSRKKGFTLVECIIAVAVFGLMSLVVFMILTNASVRAAKASESEENLAQLIENVVGDETYKKYDATSKSMTLLINNDSSVTNGLTISYNVISGYKNFIECPDCGHHANFTEFMSSTMGTVDKPETMTPIESTDFDVATCYFVCPKKYETVTFKLCCPDCGATDNYNKTSSTSSSGYLFTYLKSASGGFECSVCGSTAVMAVDSAGKFVSEKVAVDGLNVSGMVANGIRYGTSIDWTYWDDTDKKKELCQFRDVNAADPTLPSTSYPTNGGIQASLTYIGSANSSYAGEYSLKLHAYILPGSISSTNPYFVELVFPVGYTISYNTSLYPNVSRGTKEIAGTTYPTLLFKKSAGLGDVIEDYMGEFKFNLTSPESGYSFEYDYNRLSGESDNKQGLFRWFGFSSVSVPAGGYAIGRTSEDYLVTASASGLEIAK